MHQATGAFDSPGSSSRVLDICLAPGGFAKFILELQGDSTICGVTLPRTQDGYDVVVPFGPFDPRVQILFADVTACGLDYGLTAVECTKFSTKDLTLTTRRPFFGHSFDVVVCDGHIENVQKKVGAGKWRRAQRRDDDDEDDPAIGRGKATSLMYAQLILGMQRLKPGGTLVMLLFRAENWFSLQLINTFDQIAEIQLFKPAHRFAAKPSFYLVAKNVQTRSETALHAIEDWKIAWRWATLRNNPRYPYIPFRADPTDVEKFLEERGERMVELAEPIWKIQADGLEHMLGCAPISSKTAGNVPG
jgi:23S rRNA U2552 (ribose-2'-O)-methylase RlmE/FtsJ